MQTKHSKNFMVLGDINLLNGMQLDQEQFILVTLPQKLEKLNTQLISFTDIMDLTVQLVDKKLVELQSWTISTTLFRNMQIDPHVRELLNEQIDEISRVVPLFIIAWDECDYEGKTMFRSPYIYNNIRFSKDDALFISTKASNDEIICDTITDLKKILVDSAIQLHQKDQLFLNNHQCYYKKMYPGHEIENKFNLSSNQKDIWPLTIECYQLIKNGELTNYMLEYRDEFQSWDYLNYLFEVVEPENEAGYISIIPTTDGRYTIKRKWYQVDQQVRKEEHYKGLNIDGDFANYIETKFNVSLKSYPPFRRVRYDVNFESLVSGHVYGIFFDHSSIIENNQKNLTQCEVEYLRSRKITGQEQDDIIFREIHEITEWLKRFLEVRNIEYTATYYSKLSFLRDNSAQ